MKYAGIALLIDNEIEKAIKEVKAKYEQEIADLKEKYEIAFEQAKEEAKAEIIAKINE